MSVSDESILKANLVLAGFELLDRPGEFEAFRSIYKEARLSGQGVNVDIRTNVAEQGRTITLDRERIHLELFPSRSMISREFPTGKEDIARLGEVASMAMSVTSVRGKRLQAYGYNLEMEYTQDSGRPANRYLAERLFRSKPFQTVGLELVSGSGLFVCMEDGNQWSFRLEPRHSDTATAQVFLSLNFHVPKQSLPQDEEITQSLVRVWERAHEFAAAMDAEGGR